MFSFGKKGKKNGELELLRAELTSKDAELGLLGAELAAKDAELKELKSRENETQRLKEKWAQLAREEELIFVPTAGFRVTVVMEARKGDKAGQRGRQLEGDRGVGVGVGGGREREMAKTVDSRAVWGDSVVDDLANLPPRPPTPSAKPRRFH